ncbi:unnamed protein product [Cuscuta epithymum]|uniref:Uncharacterized protein n=1 Tax=Cuscuta epithymum TaxID=186058 RepID=A0AAV0EEN5_9ASTE|nr:unnamed protein product [Cuscuta epithymum]
MISISLSSSLCPATPHHQRPILHIYSQHLSSRFCSFFPKSQCPSLSATTLSKGKLFAVAFEDVLEKNWSFLDTHCDHSNEEEHKQKIDKIIIAARISENSKVLISISSDEFVDSVVDLSPSKEILVVHDSLSALACIKEKHDYVKCWQGELINVPENWAPFDVVFLYFLPAIPFELSQVLEALGKRSMPGARVVISHPQGRQMVDQQRKQYPNLIVSDLPDRATLQRVAAEKSFEIHSFIDEIAFYLAVIKFNGGA